MTDFGSTATLERPREAEGLEAEAVEAIPTAELAECNCPDVCDRDHEND